MKQSEQPFRVMKDGREICSSTSAGWAEYKSRKLKRWEMDGHICCLCGQKIALRDLTYEHPDGRGLGGGKRDDRVENCRVSHYLGNMAKGSMSLDRYLEKPLAERLRNCKGL